MKVRRRVSWFLATLMLLDSLFLSAPGCMLIPGDPVPTPPAVPRELTKVSQPPYVLEPPDIVLIDAVRLIPKSPYHIEPLDGLLIKVTGTLKEPIEGIYGVDPDGSISLGFSYGNVRVAGMSVQEARKEVENHLRTILTNPSVQLSLAQSRGLQLIRGDHLIRPDGTVGLGIYGSVYVAGMNLTQARAAIEDHLKTYMENPQISLDVFAYNSKVYYIVFDGGGYGEQVIRLPVTGNETVLDAIANVFGLPVVAAKRRIWVARPAPAGGGCDQVLPVDWHAIAQRGETDTNYQVMPGDRIYVQAERLISLNTELQRMIAPIEQLFGVSLLGAGTVSALRLRGGTGAGGGGLGGG
jgi:polysaccharide export outer membrane protein